MKLYSTKNKTNIVTLDKAILKGLPEDNGLYMPVEIPKLPQEFIKNIKDYSFQEMALQICTTLFQGYIPEDDLKEMVYDAINFPAPLVQLDAQKYVLELFHGPSLAFKDFGARFMARLMSYFDKKNDQELVILVATSGDTGGAVAAGFYKAPGIKVVILYPSGKVSHLQEQQLTTLGHNIIALEVDGTFDDCQALVKKAFLDDELTSKIRLSSANSINIARLIPQTFYYFEAYKQLENPSNVVFCVPSGNFGNLTAGLFAAQMGLPVHKFIAATNENNVVPSYLEHGKYEPKPSIRTISNAMDVGNPSNFARMLDMYGFTWNNMKEEIVGFSYSDIETEAGIREVKAKYNYTIDPHGAVGYNALKEYQQENPDTTGVILETAHPSKFLPDMVRVLGEAPFIPERLAKLADKKKVSVDTPNDYSQFKAYLLGYLLG